MPVESQPPRAFKSALMLLVKSFITLSIFVVNGVMMLPTGMGMGTAFNMLLMVSWIVCVRFCCSPSKRVVTAVTAGHLWQYSKVLDNCHIVRETKTRRNKCQLTSQSHTV